MYRFILLGLFFAILVFSCKNQDGSYPAANSNSINGEDINSELQQARTNTYQIFLVSVDNLRVREGESKKSKITDKLKEGVVVYGDGTVSSFSEKVTLRGVEHDSPYLKVTYNGNTGWVYGGGLYKLYDSDKPDDFTISFDNLVLRLANARGSVIDKGRDVLSIVKSEKSGSDEWNDMMFFLTEYHLIQFMKTTDFYKPLDSLELSDADYKAAAHRNFDMQKDRLSKRYAASGYTFSASEGMVDPLVDYLKIKNTIEGPFSDDVLIYLDIKIRESMVTMFSDAAIVCPLHVIVDHIVSIEDLIVRNPHFVRADELKSALRFYHYALLNGTANTPAKDYTTGKVNTEWVEAWKKYIATNQKGMLVKEVKSKLKKYLK